MRVAVDAHGDRDVHSIRFQGRHLMKSKKCPICGWDIQGGGIKVKVGSKMIVVCCDDCAEKMKKTARNKLAGGV